MLQTFVRPSRDLRNNYAEIARLVKEHDQVIITNQGKGESVLIGI
ncbi:MAG: type II toxin-antitoxin system prevent-host-death family antitoxin, partial [Oscillospiraceae bacterium]